MSNKITFSFGKNWYKFLSTVDEKAINSAIADVDRLIEKEKIKGKKIIDIGSGSGIHSLSFFRIGAASLFSFDYDKFSVKATKYFWEKEGKPENWKVTEGSILDEKFVNNLGQFDIVYSWGVLHHTGNMWEAIKNASTLVKPNGLFLLSLYQGVDTYEHDLKLKTKYNKSGFFGKKLMELQWIIDIIKYKKRMGLKKPYAWNEKRERGMNVYYDIKDWLGGLPYEVSSDKQILDFLAPKGFELVKKDMKAACGVYLFEKTGK